MDVTTLVGGLTGAAAVIGAVVTYLGKKGETALAGYSSLTDQLQEERADQKQQLAELREQNTELRHQLIDRDARIAELASYRSADQAEITRLRNHVQALGGQP